MSEFKGTPGQWHVDKFGDVYSANGDFCIAGCRGVIDVEADKNNAMLIAAAPELLEALQAVVRVADRATDEFDMARAAIAKALGQ